MSCLDWNKSALIPYTVFDTEIHKNSLLSARLAAARVNS